jgi:uncharacterized protein (TIGR02246 family)
MPAQSPDAIHAALAEAMRARDLDAIGSMYTDDAVLMAEPGKAVRGSAAIRDALGSFLALTPAFALQASAVIRAGDVALLRSAWEVTMPGAGGATTSFVVRPTQVAHRQSDGTWRVAIDDPSSGGQ